VRVAERDHGNVSEVFINSFIWWIWSIQISCYVCRSGIYDIGNVYKLILHCNKREVTDKIYSVTEKVVMIKGRRWFISLFCSHWVGHMTCNKTCKVILLLLQQVLVTMIVYLVVYDSNITWYGKLSLVIAESDGKLKKTPNPSIHAYNAVQTWPLILTQSHSSQSKPSIASISNS